MLDPFYYTCILTAKEGEFNMTIARTLELVTFRIKPDLPDADFERAAHAITPKLQGFPGFISRSLAKSDDGTWIDAVYWRDRPSAEHAAQAIMSDEGARAFFDLIDPSTMVFKHAEITSPEVATA
jgi:hypothetical protein